MGLKLTAKYLLTKNFSGPAIKGKRDEPEVNKWLLSRFVSDKLMPIVGVETYPVDELLFLSAVVCSFRPKVIFDWGTHIGKSARVFYEISKEFQIGAEIHTTDLPERLHHKEFPGKKLGMLIRGLDKVYQHRGDGVDRSLAVYTKLQKPVRPLFFLDGDHSFQSVKRELEKITSAVPLPLILIHDTFYQSPATGYNLGPYLAVQDFLGRNPGRFGIINTNFGLPGMTLLYPLRKQLGGFIKTVPVVTVLMPVYNGEKFLQESIESILNQTYSNIEFLIINDGSTDQSAEIIRSYRDPRITVVENKKNMGVIYSLNKGLGLVETKYIARMDADDISLPERLERQVSFMESHPKVGVCGTWTMLFSGFGKWQRLVLRFPTTSEAIKSTLLFENVLQHPSVMLRTKILRDYRVSYPSQYPHVEDYALWKHLAKLTDFAIIDKVLLHYRLHSNQIGQQHADIQTATVAKIHLQELKNLGLGPSEEERATHENISFGRYESSRDFVEKAEIWLLRLQKANAARQIYDLRAFSRILGKRWFAVCIGCIGLGPWVWDRFWQSPLSKAVALSPQMRLRFWVNSKLSFFLRPLVKWTMGLKIGKFMRRWLFGVR